MSFLEWVGAIAVFLLSCQIALTVGTILYKAVRDTLAVLRKAELLPGYNRLWWIPAYITGFWIELKEQTWAWWNGIETRSY